VQDCNAYPSASRRACLLPPGRLIPAGTSSLSVQLKILLTI
jgi:hypothetical protein